MDRIRPNLYIGNRDCAADFKALKAAKITAVLNVALDCNDPYPGSEPPQPYIPLHSIFQVKVGLIDGPGNPMPWVRLAISTLKLLLGDGHRIMVHCVAGHSRAPYIAARALMEIEGKSFDEVLGDIRRYRPAISWPSRLAPLYGSGEEGLPPPTAQAPTRAPPPPHLSM